MENTNFDQKDMINATNEAGFEELENVEELGSGRDFVEGMAAGAAIAGGICAAIALT
ncbi:hypothetical protein [Butyrivibrio sp. YAB3001]|uniref:hypothetical protein n=1 Tax=Butyrivibrio sp. YAB3001 TaxID=1520812 RepID=UPI0008F67AE0|nr:hypothetical protein [Butyrivibrio sp. YAB3001]SFC02088.1 hypothetical protein SAMN02910398_01339 [Butyrivibrio sp. YAB3001]